jgi:membrane associated rhomboid family serine protease
MKLRLLIPIVFVIGIWIINSVQFLLGLDFALLGIFPRDTTTLLGIFTSPLIHGSWGHLVSNTLPVLFLGILLFVIYPKSALAVWILNYMLTGILVWLFARSSYHIGASGIVYGLAAFLFFSGFIRMDMKSIAIAGGVAILYGGMVWGILPLQAGISWESHLFGGITGLVLAFLFKQVDIETKSEWIDENDNGRRTFQRFLKNRNG